MKTLTWFRPQSKLRQSQPRFRPEGKLQPLKLKKQTKIWQRTHCVEGWQYVIWLCTMSLLLYLQATSVERFLGSPAAGTNLLSQNTLPALYMVLYLGLLAAAAEMDSRCREVYNFLWLLAVALWLLLLLWMGWYSYNEMAVWTGGAWQETLFFVVLQELVFVRFYGRADCHAFSCCALFLYTRNGGLWEYLLHMLLTLLLLAGRQLAAGNVNRRGNLKQPVPMLPYIMFAFGVILFCC